MYQVILYGLMILLTACANTDSSVNKNHSASIINAQLGLAYLARGNIPRAKEKLLLAQQQAPKDPVVWYSMGYFLENTGNSDAAEKAYLHAIALAPANGASKNNYGTFLCRQGRYQESIQYFLLATTDPHYLAVAEAYENAGRCALKIPNRDLAEKYLRMALAQNANLPNALRLMAQSKMR